MRKEFKATVAVMVCCSMIAITALCLNEGFRSLIWFMTIVSAFNALSLKLFCVVLGKIEANKRFKCNVELHSALMFLASLCGCLILVLSYNPFFIKAVTSILK